MFSLVKTQVVTHRKRLLLGIGVGVTLSGIAGRSLDSDFGLDGLPPVLKEPWRTQIGLQPTRGNRSAKKDFYAVNQHLLWQPKQRRIDAKKVMTAIIATNAVIFGMWQLPRFSNTMQRHFLLNWDNVKSGRIHTLATCNWSHIHGWHVGLNMYVLWNFGQSLIAAIGVLPFAGIYATSGLLGSMLTLFMHRPAAVQKAAQKLATASTQHAAEHNSLGASSGLLGVIMCYALCEPSARFHIIFLPQFDFTALSGVYGILAFDTLGLLVGWRFLDHSAHLGGSLTGLFSYLLCTRLLYAPPLSASLNLSKDLLTNPKNPENSGNSGNGSVHRPKNGSGEVVYRIPLRFGDYIYEGPLVSGDFCPRPTGDIATIYGPLKTYRGKFKANDSRFRFEGEGSLRNESEGIVWSGHFHNGKPTGVGVCLKRDSLLPMEWSKGRFQNIDPMDVDFEQLNQILHLRLE